MCCANAFLLELSLAITGHSLGSPHGGIIAGFAIDTGMHVAELVRVGPPHASYYQPRDILHAKIATCVVFRDGLDPAPAVPPRIPTRTGNRDSRPG